MKSINPTSIPFDELVDRLDREIAAGNVQSKDVDELRIYNYTRRCQYKRKWNEINMIARGLILCPHKNKIVAIPFPKFFNWGEISYQLPRTGFTATQKVDGSLGIIYYWNGRWRVSTRGSLNSEQAVWAEKWLYANIDVSVLDKNVTYLAEIVYKDNKVVIEYDVEGLFLLAAYNVNTGEELEQHEVIKFGFDNGFLVPTAFSYSKCDNFYSLVEICESEWFSDEGFVVRFNDGLRVKLKGKQYTKLHRYINDVNPHRIWKMLANDEDVEGFRENLPEELIDEFDRLVSEYESKYQQFVQRINEACTATLHLSDKELGLLIQGGQHTIDKNVCKYIFAARKGRLDRVKKSIFEEFKP